MAWQTPKTDWSRQDGVRDSDLNRIEGNILELYNSSLGGSLGTVYVSSTTGNDNTGNGTSALPYRTITHALRNIPRNLNGSFAYISVAAGTYNEDVSIVGYNDGAVVITGEYGDAVSIDSIEVDSSICEIRDIALSVTSGGLVATRGSTLLCYTDIVVSGSSRGLHVLNGSRFRTDSNFTVNNSTASAVQVGGASMAYIYNLAGTNNENAIIAEEGAVVSYRFTEIATNVAGYITRYGGRIYTAG